MDEHDASAQDHHQHHEGDLQEDVDDEEEEVAGEEVSDNDDTPDLSSDDLRRLANTHFASGDYDTALPLYSLALDAARAEVERKDAADGADGAVGNDGTDEEDAEEEDGESPLVVHLCNRSACLFRMERYEEAEMDARDAVRLSHGRNAKASFRLARTQIQLAKYADAIHTTENALKHLDQNDSSSSSNAASPTAADEHELKTDEDLELARKNSLEGQRKELDRLLLHARKKKAQADKRAASGDDTTSSSQQPPVPRDITTEPRQPSIREFIIGKELGQGNFSRVVACQHKITHQKFALKIIEKKKVEQLAKRQHPNVINEVKMERRILAERLPPDAKGHIVVMYHAFQDYNNLYFLQQLHDTNGDLWSSLRAKNKMVGTYPSMAKRYAWELLDAVEHLHSHGIVHRDLKPENVLIDDRGHLVLLDFGTAKDLIWTDLNGPEFVGTADFMAPEMVRGTGDAEVEKARAEGRKLGGVDHTADLWALGAVVFQLLVGATPFAAPSPYLTFLRIQRGVLLRPWGVADDVAWDLIEKLLKVNPRERLGADGFGFSNAEEEVPEEDTKEAREKAARALDAKTYGVGYDVIRQHPYFDSIRSEATLTPPPRPVPSLRDLALRATAELIVKDSLDFDVEDNHPPGDGSSHDMLRLNPTDRKTLMHFLDRTNTLAEPRVYRRLFKKKQEAKLGRIRPETRDYVGLSRLNDGQGNFPSKEAEEDPNHPTDFTKTGSIQIVNLWSPLFVKEKNENCTEEQRKEWTAQLKDKLRLINKTRPKLVAASGYFDSSSRKLMAKINESIPVALNDGSCFYSTWTCGAQGLFIQSSYFLESKEDGKSDQMLWLKEQLEQSRLAQHHVFVFVDCDPKQVPKSLVQRLARGKALCIFGPTSEDAYETKYQYEAPAKKDDDEEDDGDDKATAEASISGDNDDDDSSDASSAANDTDHITLLVGSGDSQLRLVTLEEYGEWDSKDI